MRALLIGEGAVRRVMDDRLKDQCIGTSDDADTVFDLRLDDTQFDQTRPEPWPKSARVFALAYRGSGTLMAAKLPCPEQVLAFSLLPGSASVEVGLPMQANAGALDQARAIFAKLGLEVLLVPDGPGLVAARVIACLANEAFSALAEGVADAQTIDTAMRLGTNYPRGPLVWAEMLGLDAVLRLLEALHFETGDDRYRPHPYLRAHVAARRSILSRAAVQGVPHELA